MKKEKLNGETRHLNVDVTKTRSREGAPEMEHQPPSHLNLNILTTVVNAKLTLKGTIFKKLLPKKETHYYTAKIVDTILRKNFRKGTYKKGK